MAPRRPNYSQERNERDRNKERKKQARLQRRVEDAEKRKADRDPNVAQATPDHGEKD